MEHFEKDTKYHHKEHNGTSKWLQKRGPLRTQRKVTHNTKSITITKISKKHHKEQKRAFQRTQRSIRMKHHTEASQRSITKEHHKEALQRSITKGNTKEHHTEASQRNITKEHHKEALQRSITKERPKGAGCLCKAHWSNNFVQKSSRANFGTGWQSDF